MYSLILLAFTRALKFQNSVFNGCHDLGMICLNLTQQTFVGLEDMSWRRLEDISWRRLQDVLEANKMFTGDICI